MLDYQTIFEERGKLYNLAQSIAPWARQQELDALLKWLQPCVDETIVVTAAGGGFDAEGVLAAVPLPGCKVVCVEPSREFASMIPPQLPVHICPVDRIPMASGSVDAVVNLAAMHHSLSPADELKEWTRILRPSGRLVVADVQEGTAPARFLNEAVDRYNPSGHRGRFLLPGSITQLLSATSDWTSIEEHLEDYHWQFRSEAEMVLFTRNLFGMTQATDQEILKSIEDYLGWEHREGEFPVVFPWCLRFVVANS